MGEMKEFYTFEETVRVLGVGVRTLRRWTRNGDIFSHRRGIYHLYHYTELLYFLGKWKWKELLEEAALTEKRVKQWHISRRRLTEADKVKLEKGREATRRSRERRKRKREAANDLQEMWE